MAIYFRFLEIISPVSIKPRSSSSGDLVITIGGASVDDHDYIKDVFRDKNITTSFYKVAMKPGKPILAGKNKDTIFIGLPGNPVSALVCAHLFIKPLIGKMLGTNELANIEKQAILLNDLPANEGSILCGDLKKMAS